MQWLKNANILLASVNDFTRYSTVSYPDNLLSLTEFHDRIFYTVFTITSVTSSWVVVPEV